MPIIPAEQILADITEEPDFIDIPELGLRAPRRSALAAFWEGHRAGFKGEPVPAVLEYDDPSVYRRAHAAGTKSRKELT